MHITIAMGSVQKCTTQACIDAIGVERTWPQPLCIGERRTLAAVFPSPPAITEELHPGQSVSCVPRLWPFDHDSNVIRIWVICSLVLWWWLLNNSSFKLFGDEFLSTHVFNVILRALWLRRDFCTSSHTFFSNSDTGLMHIWSLVEQGSWAGKWASEMALWFQGPLYHLQS